MSKLTDVHSLGSEHLNAGAAPVTHKEAESTGGEGKTTGTVKLSRSTSLGPKRVEKAAILREDSNAVVVSVGDVDSPVCLANDNITGTAQLTALPESMQKLSIFRENINSVVIGNKEVSLLVCCQATRVPH